MKLFKNIVIIALLAALVPFSSSMAKRGRKLPMGAYIKSAKIHILSGDLKRYNDAIALLDSLFMYYGPTAEAIQLRGSIEVDYIDQTSDLDEKMGHVKTLVAYVDSLHLCCDKDNKDVKKKYKKNCDKLIVKNDSLIVKYWREFYNNGITLLNENIVSIQEDIANETDSSVLLRYEEDLQANVDSVMSNFALSIALDKTNILGYLGYAAMYDKFKDFKNSIIWRVKGLEYTDNRASLLQTIAYNYISDGDYGGAIPYMREYLELTPDDVLTLGNLAICYNNQNMQDSSFAVYQRVLELEPTNVDALSSVGHYFRKVSQEAADSMRTYKEAGNEALANEWNVRQEAAVDSFLFYYEKTIAQDPKNENVQYLYAIYNYFRSNWEIAIKAFSAAAEINPGEKDYWRSLGDCYIRTKEFDKSAAAYEKVIELDPTDKAIWEQLVSLYGELKRPKDKANAQKQFDALN